MRARAEAQAAALEAARAEQAGALESLRSQVSGWEQDVQDAQAVSAAQAQETVAGWVGDWAIPSAIVMCESGGNFGAVNPSSGAGGAYQILPSTWRLYGGQGLPAERVSGGAAPDRRADLGRLGRLRLGLRRLAAPRTQPRGNSGWERIESRSESSAAHACARGLPATALRRCSSACARWPASAL